MAALLTSAFFSQWWGKDVAASNLAQLFAIANSQVGDAFEHWIGQPIFIAPQVEDHNFRPGQQRYCLRARPVVVWTDLRFDVDAVFGTNSIVNPIDYRVDKRLGVVHLLNPLGTYSSPQSLRATFTAGLAVDAAALCTLNNPAHELATLAAYQVAEVMRRNQTMGQQGGSLGRGNLNPGQQLKLLDSVTQQLARYRAPRMA